MNMIWCPGSKFQMERKSKGMAKVIPNVMRYLQAPNDCANGYWRLAVSFDIIIRDDDSAFLYAGWALCNPQDAARFSYDEARHLTKSRKNSFRFPHMVEITEYDQSKSLMDNFHIHIRRRRHEHRNFIRLSKVMTSLEMMNKKPVP